MEENLIFTNDNCISCKKCVRVCTSPGASYVTDDDDNGIVHINSDRCIACGACFVLCEHDARDYNDDTDKFFEDLERGERITILLAPAFRATYPEEYGSILGGLKSLGVNRIISVAFGADICTWAYINYIQDNDFTGKISTPCPVVVSYVEHCMPKLINSMIPIYSPLLCAAIYCRKVLGITDKLAFIGPCIGKIFETDAYMEESPVHYNVTFLKLMKYLRSNNISGPDASDEIDYGLGSFYPAPGGLAENVRWFLGEDIPIRVISGKKYLYGWLRNNSDDIINNRSPFFMIDALNCQDGCIEGTANEYGRFEENDAFYSIHKIKVDSKNDTQDSPWNSSFSSKERLEALNEKFKELNLSDFVRTFNDKSAGSGQKTPSEEEADKIFISMHKVTPQSREINCSACGYESCHDMMLAIYNGFNTKKSCLHYVMDETLRLERLSLNDHLTGVMNRSGLDNVLSHQYSGMSLSVIAVDINGLKEENDTKGHEAGDRLIICAANCLSKTFGRDQVFRVGGDEFLAIQADHTEEECINRIEEFRDLMKKQGASASVGYAFKKNYDSDFATLKEIADKRMYEDKDRYYKLTGKKRR